MYIVCIFEEKQANLRVSSENTTMQYKISIIGVQDVLVLVKIIGIGYVMQEDLQIDFSEMHEVVSQTNKYRMNLSLSKVKEIQKECEILYYAFHSNMIKHDLKYLNLCRKKSWQAAEKTPSFLLGFLRIYKRVLFFFLFDYINKICNKQYSLQ